MSWKAARLLALVLVGVAATVPAVALDQPPAHPSFALPAAPPTPPWLLPAPPQSPDLTRIVPEPATFALLAFSFLALRRRPR